MLATIQLTMMDIRKSLGVRRLRRPLAADGFE